MRSLVKRGLAVALSAAVVGLGGMTAEVRADGPLIGANIGAAFPLSKYRRTIDPDIGGTAGMEGGYRFDLSENLALSLFANPQFFLYDGEHDCCDGAHTDDDVGSVFSITGGPRLSILSGPVEWFINGAGGYYRDISGQMSDDGAGFNAGGGVAFELSRNATLRFLGRYDYAKMVARPNSDVERQWASGGHRFPVRLRARGGSRCTATASAASAAGSCPLPPPPPPTERRGG